MTAVLERPADRLPRHPRRPRPRRLVAILLVAILAIATIAGSRGGSPGEPLGGHERARSRRPGTSGSSRRRTASIGGVRASTARRHPLRRSRSELTGSGANRGQGRDRPDRGGPRGVEDVDHERETAQNQLAQCAAQRGVPSAAAHSDRRAPAERRNRRQRSPRCGLRPRPAVSDRARRGHGNGSRRLPRPVGVEVGSRSTPTQPARRPGMQVLVSGRHRALDDRRRRLGALPRWASRRPGRRP